MIRYTPLAVVDGTSGERDLQMKSRRETRRKNAVLQIRKADSSNSCHIWEEYLEAGEDICYTLENKEIYMLRKETIESVFESAKEQHGFQYTQYIGNARMNMKAGVTFACMNIKNLAKFWM